MKIPGTWFKAAMIGGWLFLLATGFALQGCDFFIGQVIREAIRHQKGNEEATERAQARASHRPPLEAPAEAITVDKLPLAIAFGNLSNQWDKDKFEHAAQTERFDNFSDFLLDQPRKATPQEIMNVRAELENEGFKFQVCDQNRWCTWETK